MDAFRNYLQKLRNNNDDTTSKSNTGDFTCTMENMNNNAFVFDNFDLPISYLDKKTVHKLDDTIKTDLELVVSPNTPIYHYLLRPGDEFAKDLIPKWSQSYTNNIDFLQDSQTVIENMQDYKAKCGGGINGVDDGKLKKCWRSIKEDPNFIEKHNFMEWSILKHLNEQDGFLLSMSYLHVLSPILSLIMPIIILIIPFFLIKLQGYSITMATYIEVLKDIGKHHFIGKMLSSCDGFSPKTFGYVIVSVVFYFMQIYQNVISLSRFHRNMGELTNQLYDLKVYTKHSIQSMETFLGLNKDLLSYTKFCEKVHSHKVVLEEIDRMLDSVEPFQVSLGQLNKSGYLLMCYYNLYNKTEYSDALKYSFGFRGYIEGLAGLHQLYVEEKVSTCDFDLEEQTEIKGEYYPPFINNETIIVNDCDLSNNIVLTGVNASGKTTYLKSSLINILFSQQFGLGFYKTAVINPYTHLHSYLNIPDTSGRDSLFQAESRRCKEIIDSVVYSGKGSRHFCMFDELYSGTNPVEATQSSYGFLLYLSKHQNVDFILTTHYVELCKKLDDTGCNNIVNYRTMIDKNNDGGGFIYRYKIETGICDVQGAIEVLKAMDYPSEILETINGYDSNGASK